MLQVPCLGAVPRHLSSTSDRKGHLLPLSSHSLTLGPRCASRADTALRLFFTHRPHGEVGSQVCCAGLSIQEHVREGQGGVVHRGAGTADPERWAPQTPRVRPGWRVPAPRGGGRAAALAGRGRACGRGLGAAWWPGAHPPVLGGPCEGARVLAGMWGWETVSSVISEAAEKHPELQGGLEPTQHPKAVCLIPSVTESEGCSSQK